MTNSPDEMAWSPMQFATQLQEASQEMTAQQMQAFTELLSGRRDSSPSTLDGAELTALGTEMAMFKTRVQSGGRISIPDTEREVLGIDEGDIVQTFVIPVPQSGTETDQ